MKKMKKNYFFFAVLFFGFLSILPSVVSARIPADEIRSKFNLPALWIWDEIYKDKGGSSLLGMDVKGLGKSIGVKVDAYELSLPAKEFLESVRKIMMESGKEDSFSSVEDKSIQAKPWAFFKVKYKSGVGQEVWARNISNYILLIKYTSTSQYFEPYYKDFDTFLTQASSL